MDAILRSMLLGLIGNTWRMGSLRKLRKEEGGI